MAAAPGAHPHYSLPKLSPEQVFVQKKQGEEIQKDVRNLNALDTTAAFTSLHDAVVRLLPFHLFNAIDPAAADLDDTPDHMGADLMASRQEAWQELCMAKANDLRRRADMHGAAIAAFEQKMDQEALTSTHSLDRYAMAKLQQEDLKRKIATDKALLQKLAPVVAPTPAAAGGTQGLPAAALAAAKAAAAAGGKAPGAMLVPGAAGGAGLGGLTVQQQLAAQQLAQQRLVQQQQLLQQLPPAQQQAILQQQLIQQQAAAAAAAAQQGQMPNAQQLLALQQLQQQQLLQQALLQQQQQLLAQQQAKKQ